MIRRLYGGVVDQRRSRRRRGTGEPGGGEAGEAAPCPRRSYASASLENSIRNRTMKLTTRVTTNAIIAT